MPKLKFIISLLALSLSSGYAVQDLYCNCIPDNPKTQNTCACNWNEHLAIPHSASRIFDLKCTNPTYKYIQDWNWKRDSKLPTCWDSLAGNLNYTSVSCHNWNTIWGDTHYVALQAVCGNISKETRPSLT